MISLTRKKCFITGAASGIGRATAIAAAAQGAELVLTDIDAAGLEAVAVQIRQSGGKVLHSRALDIADYVAVRQYANELHAQFGSLDVLMNIAGIAIWGSVETLAHAHLPQDFLDELPSGTKAIPAVASLEHQASDAVRAAMNAHAGNVSAAARQLGISRNTLYRKLKALGLA